MSDFEQPGELVISPRAPLVIQTSVLSDDEINRVWRIAKSLAASGMFKDVTQAEQAFGRILLGRDLGLSPTQALMVLDVVEGNVRVRSVQLAAWVRQHPGYDYKVKEHDDTHCVIEFFTLYGLERRPFEPPAISSFSMEDAKQAHLIKDHPKSPWKAHPRNMLWARAMSNGVRWYCPEVTGGIPVYTEADSFEDRSVGAGEGDGSDPGWENSGLTEAQVRMVEYVIARADEAGYAGLGSGARGSIQMKLSGQPPKYLGQWLEWAEGELVKAETPVATAVEEPAQEGGES